MRGALATVDAVERVRQRLLAGNVDDQLVAEGLSAVLRGRSFAAGVDLADGWLRVVRQRDQERALAAIAATLAPGTANGLAQQIAGLLARYYARGWLRDSITGERPDGSAGLAFDYLRAEGPMSAEAIRRGPLVKILGDATNQRGASSAAA